LAWQPEKLRCVSTELLVVLNPVAGSADVTPGGYEVETVVDQQRA
jgi:hypothetical protein